MALGMMIGMGACLEINQPTADKVCSYLENVYGCEFTATHIGDRLNTSHALLYIVPKNDPDLVFTATIDKDGTITENYVTALKCREVERVIDGHLQKSGLTGASEVYIADSVSETDTGISVSEFLSRHGIERFHVRLIFIPGDNYGEKVLNALIDTGKSLEIDLGALVFAMREDAYEPCRQEMEDYPGVTLAAIQNYDPLGMQNVLIDNGVSSVTPAEMEESIGA